MELTIKVAMDEMLTARRAADIAARMGAYDARVLLRCGDMTVNAKSLMGLISLGISDGMSVTVIASGEDEARAVCALAKLLGA